MTCLLQVVAELKRLLASETGQAVHTSKATDVKLDGSSESSHTALSGGEDSGVHITKEKLPCAASAVRQDEDITSAKDCSNPPGLAPSCGCIIC